MFYFMLRLLGLLVFCHSLGLMGFSCSRHYCRSILSSSATSVALRFVSKCNTFGFCVSYMVDSSFVSFWGYIGLGWCSTSLIDCASLCALRGGKS